MLPVNYNKQTSVSYQTVSMLIIINNVRWQYHVKDIAWAPYKITQTKQTKGQRRWQSVVTGRQQLAVQYNHDRLVIVKWRPKKYSLQLTMERCQWPCISDRWWQAVPRTCLSHREGTIAKRWVSGGQYDQHGCVSRTQTALSIDIRCPEKTPSKVRRRCSMKTVVGQNAQPECDLLRNSQPMELTKQWGYVFWPPRWENKTSGGIRDGLQLVW